MWRVDLGVGAVLGAAYLLLPPVPARLLVWPTIGASSVAAIAVGARRHRPARPHAWYLIAAGLATFVVGDRLYALREWVLHANPTFPSAIDALYLATYPLAASLIDATVIATGAGMLSGSS